MSPADIRKRAAWFKHDAKYDDARRNEETAAALDALADVYEIAKHEHGKRGGDGGEPECALCVAVDRVESLPP